MESSGANSGGLKRNNRGTVQRNAYLHWRGRLLVHGLYALAGVQQPEEQKLITELVLETKELIFKSETFV